MNRVTLISEPGTILVRGVNWLGDAVMTTPALLQLRARFPQSKITLFTPQKLADLWRHFPGIDEVLPFSPDSSLLAEGRRLRAHRFDLAISLPNSFRSAMELWLGRARERVGFAGNGRSWSLTHAITRPPTEMKMVKRSVQEIRGLISHAATLTSIPVTAHHLHHYLHLVSVLGASSEVVAPQLRVTPEEKAQFQTSFIPGGSQEPVIRLGLNPGAEYGGAKRWPEDRYIEVAVSLHETTGCQWILFGGPGDRALTERIEVGIRQRLSHPHGANHVVVNLAGRTRLRELMAGLASCRALLTNDSGPMHVAAALGTPVIVPFGSTSPELTAPGIPGKPGPHHFLRVTTPCAPCFLRECPVDFRCMTGIGADAVTAAIRAVIQS